MHSRGSNRRHRASSRQEVDAVVEVAEAGEEVAIVKPEGPQRRYRMRQVMRMCSLQTGEGEADEGEAGNQHSGRE